MRQEMLEWTGHLMNLTGKIKPPQEEALLKKKF
jgi:hypothetical protein